MKSSTMQSFLLKNIENCDKLFQQCENCLNEAFVEDVYDEQLKRELTVLNEDSILNASCPKIEDFFNE